MQTQQIAYDLDYFNQNNDKRKQKLKVVKNKSSFKLNSFFKTFKMVFLVAIILTLAFLVLLSQSTNTELTAKITESNELLKEEMANTDFLENQLGGSLDLERVEKYATQNLGMIKPVKSQVEYITIQKENEISNKKQNLVQAVDAFTSNFLNVIESLAP